MSASTLFAGLAGCLVKVGPVLALTGSTGQARPNADLDAVRIGACDRYSGLSSPAPGSACGRAGRCSRARTCPRFAWPVIGAATRFASRCKACRRRCQRGLRRQIGPSPGDPGSIRNRQPWPVAATGEPLLTRMPSRQVTHALSKGNAASRSLVTASTRDPPSICPPGPGSVRLVITAHKERSGCH